MIELIKNRIFFILIILGLLVLYYSPIKLEESIIFWCFCHLILNAMVVHYHLNFYRNRNNEVFPVLLSMALLNVLNFSISIFWVAHDEYQLSPVSDEAMMYSFFSYMIFYIVYYLFYDGLWNNIKTFHNFELNKKIVDQFIYIC